MANPALTVRYVGGPTALVTIGGGKLLLDPTFDPPGDHPIGDRRLTKTQGPAITPDQLGPIDAVLLSHDQHPDNLDVSGRRLLADAPLALSTAAAAERIGPPVTALPNWSTSTVTAADGATVTVTGLPAQHGPDGSEALVGEVTGFVLSGPQLPTV